MNDAEDSHEDIIDSDENDDISIDKAISQRFTEVIEALFPDIKSRNARATALGLSERMIRYWESNEKVPLRALARVGKLGGDVVYIITGHRQQNVSPVEKDNAEQNGNQITNDKQIPLHPYCLCCEPRNKLTFQFTPNNDDTYNFSCPTTKALYRFRLDSLCII